jgi:hypothetical protein
MSKKYQLEVEMHRNVHGKTRRGRVYKSIKKYEKPEITEVLMPAMSHC